MERLLSCLEDLGATTGSNVAREPITRCPLTLYLSSGGSEEDKEAMKIGARTIEYHKDRPKVCHFKLGPGSPSLWQNACYVCGPPAMTDAFVEYLQCLDGMDPRKVMFEKWW